jgi:hypothetical protein
MVMALPSIGRKAGSIRGLRSRFKVEGLGDHTTSVSALAMGFDAMSGTDGADVPTTNSTPGQPWYQPMRVTGLIHKGSFTTLQDWMKKTHDGVGNVERKTLTYHIMHPQQDTPIKSYILHDCYPTAFNYIEAEVDGGEMMQFDISFTVTRIEMQG